MKKGWRRIRGSIGTGLTWAVGWAVGGVAIGATSLLLPGLPWDYFFDVFDAPLPALAVPGFVGGAIFSIVLGIAARRRHFEELSLPLFAALGAAGGLLLSLVPATLHAVGLATLDRPEPGLWQSTVAISGPFMLFSALSACGTLLLARRAQAPGSHSASGHNLDPGGDGGLRERLPGADPSLDWESAPIPAERVHKEGVSRPGNA